LLEQRAGQLLWLSPEARGQAFTFSAARPSGFEIARLGPMMPDDPEEPEAAPPPSSPEIVAGAGVAVVRLRGLLLTEVESHMCGWSDGYQGEGGIVARMRSAHQASQVGAIVVDVRTGEILALANLPTYDPNNRAALTGGQLRNRAITDTYEPGSTMKPFSVAMALEAGKVKPSTPIDTSPGKLTIGTATIGDAHRYGVLTVEQVLQKSSNVGTVKMALQLPPQRMWEGFTSLGFGQPPQIGFPGAVAGRVRPFKTWKPIEQATMSYGQGISV
jgi:cell division protein FtsI/penicillin-binding protein 2